MAGKFAVGLALFGAYANAFPRVVLERMADPNVANRLLPRGADAASSRPQGKGALPLVPPPFDAKQQYVSTTGKYAWKAPTATDQRGECPGLNAMANHGYLPHSGIGTIADFAESCQKVYGMSPELAIFLATYGAVVDGTLTQWSVGGTEHLGIGGAHGNYESDSSLAYGDLHQYGDSSELIMSQFMGLYDMQPDASTANYNLDVLREYRKTRFQQSIDNNPLYYYGLFSGTVVTQAGFTFIYRFFANKSEEYPEGLLDKNVLRSFYSTWYGTEEKPEYKKGHERIPDNWYKRNLLDEYGVPYLEADILYFSQVTPDIPLPGCNAGKLDSYQTISAETLTKGAYSQQEASASPLCFSLQSMQAFLPKVTGLSAVVLKPLDALFDGLSSKLQGCKSVTEIDSSPLEACPGFALFGGPKGAIAPGARPN